MLESLHFIYDNFSSEDMGIFNVQVGGGLYEEYFLPERVINEQKPFGREKPYLINVTHEPISFSMTLLFNNGIGEAQRKKVARWLYQDYYKPLIFSSDPNKIFYALLEGESSLTHNGAGEGYITVNVRCDSPYAYSPEYFEENILPSNSNNNGEKEFTISTANTSKYDLTKLESSNGVFKIKGISKWGELPHNSKWGDII